MFANVRILNAPFPIDKSYCYEVPLQLEKHLQPGSVVVVPFGGGNSTKMRLSKAYAARRS